MSTWPTTESLQGKYKYLSNTMGHPSTREVNKEGKEGRAGNKEDNNQEDRAGNKAGNSNKGDNKIIGNSSQANRGIKNQSQTKEGKAAKVLL